MERDEELKVITELLDSSTSDRVVGVLAGAYVDERLLEKLKKRLISIEEDADLSYQIFENGPLGSFAARINMGYLLGIFSKEVRLELTAISKIRNAFAHRTSIDFTSASVTKLLQRLTLVNRFRHPEQPTYFSGGSTDPDEVWFAPQGLFPTTGRGLYLASTQILLGYIWNAPDLPPHRPKPIGQP
jgi:hypothetical protein